MSVWVCVPSARPVPEVAAWVAKWRERGYYVALWRDGRAPGIDQFGEATTFYGGDRPYPGYAVATNELISIVFKADPSCDWVVATGDDTDPDMAHTADEIAEQCGAHFSRLHACLTAGYELIVPPGAATFGVIQPTGDRFAGGSIDRICGSPWLGREFCRRINQGRGPFWPEYTHCFADEELQNVATKLGILWQRRDLTHYHHHYTRVPGRDIGQAKAIPPHLVEVTSAAHWVKYKALFEKRKAAGFPGSEPIA